LAVPFEPATYHRRFFLRRISFFDDFARPFLLR